MQVVYGGAPKRAQIAQICHRRGPPCHMIVGTPGRLNDLIDIKRVDCAHVSMLVLDEADRMLDMGFEPQLDQLLEAMPKQMQASDRPLPSQATATPESRQTLFYTATWPREVQQVCMLDDKTVRCAFSYFSLLRATCNRSPSDFCFDRCN